MGKTIRKNNQQSRSRSYFADKSRSFASNEDRTSHHRQRKQNRDSDEVTFIPFDCKSKRTVAFRNGNVEDQRNVPTINNQELFQNTDATIEDALESWTPMADQGYVNSLTRYCGQYAVASLKQVKRRREMAPFIGHRRNDDGYAESAEYAEYAEYAECEM